MRNIKREKIFVSKNKLRFWVLVLLLAQVELLSSLPYEGSAKHGLTSTL